MEFTIPFYYYVILILIIALATSVLYIYYLKRGQAKEDRSYIQGLKYMAEGDNRLAVEKFKDAVRVNSDNVDAYLKIGIILRNEGLLNNAIRIHKDLTLRSNLKEGERSEIYRNLALDYWEAGSYDKAEACFNELRNDKKYLEWTTPYLVKIYEEQNNWKKAFAVFNQLKESTATKGKLRLAMYKVREGMALTKIDEEKSARALFKEAIKIDTSCAPAYIYLGDSYWRENRKSDAINTWTDLIKKNPEKAYLAFQRLEKAWFEKGQFSKIEELYQGLISADEENAYARIALADIYRKKGEYKQSLKLLEDMTKYEQHSDIVEQELVKVLMDQSKYEEASKKAIKLIEQKTKPFHDKLKAELDQLEQS